MSLKGKGVVFAFFLHWKKVKDWKHGGKLMGDVRKFDPIPPATAPVNTSDFPLKLAKLTVDPSQKGVKKFRVELPNEVRSQYLDHPVHGATWRGLVLDFDKKLLGLYNWYEFFLQKIVICFLNSPDFCQPDKPFTYLHLAGISRKIHLQGFARALAQPPQKRWCLQHRKKMPHHSFPQSHRPWKNFRKCTWLKTRSLVEPLDPFWCLHQPSVVMARKLKWWMAKCSSFG